MRATACCRQIPTRNKKTAIRRWPLDDTQAGDQKRYSPPTVSVFAVTPEPKASALL
jgi:hypothetical protein